MSSRAVLLLACAAALLSDPLRAEDLEVVLARSGVRPKVLNLRKGETTRLVLKSGDGEHCFAIDALRVEKRVVAGRTTVLEVTPDRAGTFPFHCCLEPDVEALRGKVVVAE
jgi:heme/copper-type cytochrome/quinol oxidase subunit 2